jgi:hypothetical protein
MLVSSFEDQSGMKFGKEAKAYPKWLTKLILDDPYTIYGKISHAATIAAGSALGSVLLHDL